MSEVRTTPAKGGDRPLPKLWPDTEFYWTSGADGHLRLMRCHQCGRYYHPPTPVCRYDGSEDVGIEIVSGDATIWTFAVVHQPFVDWLELPYVIGIVSIDEEPDLHLTTNIVDCPPEEVRIGMPVHVRFEQIGEIFLPLFAPRGQANA